MSRVNGKSTAADIYDDMVVLVSDPLDLPYRYVSYETVKHARVNHPDDKLYVFEGKYPKGYKIVAFPLVMLRPEDCKDHRNCEEADNE
jgi:hypothetical protein